MRSSIFETEKQPKSRKTTAVATRVLFMMPSPSVFYLCYAIDYSWNIEKHKYVIEKMFVKFEKFETILVQK